MHIWNLNFCRNFLLRSMTGSNLQCMPFYFVFFRWVQMWRSEITINQGTRVVHRQYSIAVGLFSCSASVLSKLRMLFHQALRIHKKIHLKNWCLISILEMRETFFFFFLFNLNFSLFLVLSNFTGLRSAL